MVDVVFKRIRGRIIPIKKSEKRKRAESVGLAAAGMTTAIGGQYVSGRIVGRQSKVALQSARQVFQSKGINSLNEILFGRENKSAVEMGIRGKGEFQKAIYKTAMTKKFLKQGTFLLGSAMVGEGIARLLDPQNEGERNSSQNIASQVSASVLTYAGVSAFKRGYWRGFRGKAAMIALKGL